MRAHISVGIDLGSIRLRTGSYLADNKSVVPLWSDLAYQGCTEGVFWFPMERMYNIQYEAQKLSNCVGTRPVVPEKKQCVASWMSIRLRRQDGTFGFVSLATIQIGCALLGAEPHGRGWSC